jgi:hypothetical protein
MNSRPPPTEDNENYMWKLPSLSLPVCAKCGYAGELWHWRQITFCRACLCFSRQTPRLAIERES